MPTKLVRLTIEQTRVAVSGNRKIGKDELRKKYTPEDLQNVQDLEEKISEVIMVLEANNDIMQSLSGFYVKLMNNADLNGAIKKHCADHVREFAAEVGDLMYDASMQLRRAKLLVKITADRKGLVCVKLSSKPTTELTTDTVSGSSASSRPGIRGNTGIDQTLQQRSNDYAHYNHCYTCILACNFRFGKLSLLRIHIHSTG